MLVCSPVRIELVIPPSSFTSARSCANDALWMLGGGPGRNWSTRCIVQGVTYRHDRKGLAPVRGSGCQYPSPAGGVYIILTSDPSFERSATICTATSSPTATPSLYFSPPGTCDSD